MGPSNSLSLESIFFTALEMGGVEDRDAFLNEACGGDKRLRRQVERMLAAQPRAGGFLESPAVKIDRCVELPPHAEAPGTIIGRYKLVEEIAEGGMGIVYLAEQQQPVRRKVALKIVKPGMDTREVIRRFEAERQALAMMDHPNIAKVFDAGETESGRSYFVMELVRGIPLTEYCDRHELPVRERLELFVPVCQAVHHAHQKGIIHRDIKPSNAMVALYDGRAVPKVIDFGIAKALDVPLTERTLFTHFGQMVGTPLYMSPEQAEAGDLDIDTRSDVYSLGVMLYELLTGSTPFDGERVKKSGYDEIRRMIREDEPQSPSTRVNTLAADADTKVFAWRKSDPARLSGLLRGDLDCIVMKALEKDRRLRYGTAADFAHDIEHYLADEPIEARSPGLGARLAKWGRRHRKPLTGVGLIALGAALAAAYFAVTMLISTDEGTVKLDFPSAEAAKSVAISVDGNEIRIEKPGEPIKLHAGRHQIRIRQGDVEIVTRDFDVLSHGSQILHVSMPDPLAAKATSPPERHDPVRELIDSAQHHANIGNYEKAIAEFSDAIRLDSSDAGAWELRAQAQLMNKQMDDYRKGCREMLQHFSARNDLSHGACYAVCRSCSFAPDAVLAWPAMLALADRANRLRPDFHDYVKVRGLALYRAGRWKEAAAALAEGHRLFERRLENDKSPFLRLGDAENCLYMAMVARQLGKDEEARKWFAAALAEKEIAFSEQRAGKVAFYWCVLAPIELAEAETAAQLGISDAEHRLIRARCLTACGNYDEAIGVLRELLHEQPTSAALRDELARALGAKGDSLIDVRTGWLGHKLEDALASYAEAAQWKPQAADYRRRKVDTLFQQLDVRMRRGDFGGAWQDGEEAVRTCPDDFLADVMRGTARLCAPHPDYVAIIADFSRAGQRAAEPSAAEVRSQHLPGMIWPSFDFDAWCDAGQVCLLKRDAKAAIAFYDKAFRLDPQQGRIYFYRGDAYRQQGDFKRAIAELDKAVSRRYPIGAAEESAAYYCRALCRSSLRQSQDALNDLRAGEQIGDRGALSMRMLAWCLATTPDPAVRDAHRAVDVASRAVAALSGTMWNMRIRCGGNPWTALGVAQYRGGQWQEAISALDHSLLSAPVQGDPCGWLFLAMAHKQLGHSLAATEWFGKASQWRNANKVEDEELDRLFAEASGVLRMK
jgi:serine/threonine protein kinase/tetratricopeptide (TPR) repeat protein